MFLHRSNILVGFLLMTAAEASTTNDPDRDVINVENIPPVPVFRFTAWSNLPKEIRDHAHAAGYQAKDWDTPGKFEIEQEDWESLDSNVRNELQGMGFTAPQWDCYMNHYLNYGWDELNDETSGLEVQDAYATLGWTAESWANDGTPDTDGKYWEDLSHAQREAATSVCYTQGLWDEVSIPFYGFDDGAGDSVDKDEQADNSESDDEVADAMGDVYETIYDPNDRSTYDGPTGPGTAHNSRNIPVPMFRYNPWDELTPEVQKLASKAKYDEKNWNTFNRKTLEHKDFEMIGQQHPEVLQALKDIGFTAEQWDCYMSHYRTYDWHDLDDAGVQEYFETLGWTRQMWIEQDEPDVFGMYWPDLSEEQQNAAYELCYFRETWDEVSLQFWPRTTSNTDWAAYAKAHPAKTGGAGAVLITLLVGSIFACAYYLRTKRIPAGSSGKDGDLEMFDDGGYKDQPIDQDAHKTESYDDGYEEEKTDKLPEVI